MKTFENIIKVSNSELLESIEKLDEILTTKKRKTTKKTTKKTNRKDR